MLYRLSTCINFISLVACQKGKISITLSRHAGGGRWRNQQVSSYKQKKKKHMFKVLTNRTLGSSTPPLLVWLHPPSTIPLRGDFRQITLSSQIPWGKGKGGCVLCILFAFLPRNKMVKFIHFIYLLFIASIIHNNNNNNNNNNQTVWSPLLFLFFFFFFFFFPLRGSSIQVVGLPST